jgi:hypothetical protein
MACQFENEAQLALLAEVAPLRGRTPPQWRRVAHLIAQINHHRQSLVAASEYPRSGGAAILLSGGLVTAGSLGERRRDT